MRVTRKLITSFDTIPRPTSRMDTTLLWTDRGVIHKDSHLLFIWSSHGDQLDVDVRPFRGSVSKVYHAEPATITWYGSHMWREQTPTSDIMYMVENGYVNQRT